MNNQRDKFYFIHKLSKKALHMFRLIREAIILKNDVISKNEDIESVIHALKTSNSFRLDQQEIEITQIFHLIKKHRPKVLCEIGSFRGGSLFIFCYAAQDGSEIFSIDINYPLKRKVAHSRFAFKNQKIVCIEGDSHSTKTWRKLSRKLRNQNIDFLFIDGDHTFEGVQKDFEMYYPLVSSQGIIAFHDIVPDSTLKTGKKSSSYTGGVPQFWEYIKTKGYRTQEFIQNRDQDGFGIGVIYKRRTGID